MKTKSPTKLEKLWIKKVASFIGKKNDKLSERTREMYATRIRRIWKLLEPELDFKGKNFLNRRVNEVINVINNSDMADSSKAGSYSAILSTYNADSYGIANNGKKMYQREIDYWGEKNRNAAKKQEKTESEKEKWVTKEELLAGRRKLHAKAMETNDIYDWRDFVMFSLFTLLPPRRAGDYGEMKISRNLDYKGNAVIPITTLGKKKFGKFIFNDFKLANKKGKEVFDRKYISQLPKGEEILTVLDNWLNIARKGYFLLDARTPVHMSKAIARLSQKAVGKPINANVFRHMYVENFLETAPYLSEKEKVADFMSHTVAQQELYRKKLEKNENVKNEK